MSSGDVSTPNLKLRSVFSVRDYPRGCGPAAILSPPRPETHQGKFPPSMWQGHSSVPMTPVGYERSAPLVLRETHFAASGVGHDSRRDGEDRNDKLSKPLKFKIKYSSVTEGFGKRSRDEEDHGEARMKRASVSGSVEAAGEKTGGGAPPIVKVSESGSSMHLTSDFDKKCISIKKMCESDSSMHARLDLDEKSRRPVGKALGKSIKTKLLADDEGRKILAKNHLVGQRMSGAFSKEERPSGGKFPAGVASGSPTLTRNAVAANITEGGDKSSSSNLLVNVASVSPTKNTPVAIPASERSNSPLKVSSPSSGKKAVATQYKKVHGLEDGSNEGGIVIHKKPGNLCEGMPQPVPPKGSDSSNATSTQHKKVYGAEYGSNVRAIVIHKKPDNLGEGVPQQVPPKGSDSLNPTSRDKVMKALRLFQLLCRTNLQEEEAKSKSRHSEAICGRPRVRRIDLNVSGILKKNGRWVNTGEPIIGHVPGVEVGDEFQYRVELAIVGLHHPFQGGIDTVMKNGMRLATSIVASGGYPDDVENSDGLIYTGSGGKFADKHRQSSDQKLERGNLGLSNSIAAKTPVRVIYGVKEPKGKDREGGPKLVSKFTYDGLYGVEARWTETGPDGCSVFKFKLKRMAGQPELALKEVRRLMKSNVREGLCSEDISKGKEGAPICVVNTVDTERPRPFRYITKNVYPSGYIHNIPKGCDCVADCLDSEKCACAVKNGGELPYNYNGAIVRAKPLVYECGPSCKCPPSCYNRVSQHGIKLPLEIFKTGSRGWGVRSLSSIQPGTFICEYNGELLNDTDAEQRSNDEYLFDIGRNYEAKTLWEGLPSDIPGLVTNAPCETVEDVGFTIDAADCGNVGRFINHSCSPNLYAQNVLYDHDDKRMPHIMFFAADIIPAFRELTYHYNYNLDQVRDSQGNIKRKECYCGSQGCTGRLY